MDSQDQLPPEGDPVENTKGVSPDLLSHHESTPGATSEDVEDIAALFHRVGSELHTIDHHHVGSGEAGKALQLDQSAVFGDLIKTSTPHPSAPEKPIIPAEAVNTTKEPFAPVLKHSPAPVIHPPVQQPVLVSDTSDLERRVTRLESAVKAFRKAKKIKRGNTYTVSSNSMNGKIKDGDLIADFIMSELAKGVKTITIKLNDSKNTE